MKTKWTLIASLLIIGGCSAPSQAPQAIEMKASIKDVMDSMIDPSGDFMFEAVAEIADEHGVTQKAPKTEDDWMQVRNRAYILYEGMNLVMMEGRKVAQPADKSKFPQVELEPADIQKLIDDDRASFIRRAKRLQEAATMSLKAVEVRDTKALFSAIEHIDRACENCHLHYWYPKDSRALSEAKKSGVYEN